MTKTIKQIAQLSAQQHAPEYFSEPLEEFEPHEWVLTAMETYAVQQAEKLEQQNKELKKALKEIIDATEDKGGQFRAWHQHLRSTTSAGRTLLDQLDTDRASKLQRVIDHILR